MKQSSKLMMLTLGAAMLSTGLNESTQENPKLLTKEDRERIRKINEKKKVQILKKGGMKEFDYNGNIILALNKKNADRKAKKLGYI